jgi:hypothetical protein
LLRNGGTTRPSFSARVVICSIADVTTAALSSLFLATKSSSREEAIAMYCGRRLDIVKQLENRRIGVEAEKR